MLRKFTPEEIESYFQSAKNMYQEAKLPEPLIEKLLTKSKEQLDFIEEELTKIEKNPTIISAIELANKNIDEIRKLSYTLKEIGFSDDENERIHLIRTILREHPLHKKIKMLFDDCFEKIKKDDLQEETTKKLHLFIQNALSKIDNPTTRKCLAEEQKSALDLMKIYNQDLAKAEEPRANARPAL